MAYEMLALTITDPATGTVKARVHWTPEGAKTPPSYTTVFEALAAEWEPGDPVYVSGTPFLWMRRRYTKQRTATEERDPLGGWDTG